MGQEKNEDAPLESAPPDSINGSGSGMRDRITFSPPPPIPLPFDQLSFDMVVRQRDEAHARVEELEAIAGEASGSLAEIHRLRELLRMLAEVLGVQEFESLLEVAQARMEMLSAIQKKCIAEGMRDAARQAALSNMHDELGRLREEIQRLKARP